VARVAVDVPLAHLDRPFDYSVPDALDAEAQPGTRVRVRFSGRLVDGFIIDRVAESDHARLAPIQRVISPVPALTPEVLELARAVADRYAGTLPDVLRAAIPPRHARAETLLLAKEAEPIALPDVTDLSAWSDYAGGAAFARRLAGGERGMRAVWTCAPGVNSSAAADWPRLIARTAIAGARSGDVVIVVPDARDLARVSAALDDEGGAGAYAVLAADAGPQRRYTAFLRVLTGRVPIALGTRAAAFAPVGSPSLLILWDDGDESLSEPHAPGWHAREVLALRSQLTGSSLLVGGFTRTAETESWIATKWAVPLVPSRAVTRQLAPRVIADHDDTGRIPRRAYDAARDALTTGPVLVQVGRRGYVPTLACQDCRERASCPACGGPLALGSRGGAPTCGWCGTSVAPWRCRGCGGQRLRAVSVGSGRTAEELGRAFPGVPVITSTGERAVDRVGPEPALVVATTGTEPWAEAGYTAVLLLDAAAQTSRVALRAGEETARRWFSAAALARPGAPVVVTADAALPVVQALIRWDPAWLAARELAERRELGLPPVVRVATLTGEPVAVEGAAGELPPSVRVLGPLPVPGSDDVRALVTVDRRHGSELARALGAVAATRTARKAPTRLQIAVDPPDWGGD
jgi:primosomal protein N' (replication factor Y) (superfamily II helicase)